MLSKRDCLDYLNLNEKELNVLMSHENIQFIIAIKKCSILLDSPEGILYLHSVLLENFSQKVKDGKEEEAVEAFEIYQGFSNKFPMPNYLSTR